MERLPDSVQNLWRFGGVLTGGLIGMAFAFVAFGLLFAADAPQWMLIAPALPVLIGGSIGYWWAGVKFRNWGWQISERWIEAKHGVLGHHRIVIPRNRVQTVTTNSGPIDRMLDLETVTVHTAGAGAPNLTIPHLASSTVALIRSELGQGVRG